MNEFLNEYGHFILAESDDANEITRDVLLLIMSNLSDVQEMGISTEANERLNSVKSLISKYRGAIK